MDDLELGHKELGKGRGLRIRSKAATMKELAERLEKRVYAEIPPE